MPPAIRALKALVFVAALVPVGRLATGALFFPEWLGANPAEFITRSTGDWTLRLLLITLAVTLKTPADVGVPAMRPVAAAICRPGGRPAAE